MNKLRTERLIIFPLDIENFRLFIDELSPEMQECFMESYQKAVGDKENILWYTNWQVYLKEENKVIAGIIFKGLPNKDGEVEVGYGTDEQYQNRGYMTETLGCLMEWAFSQSGVRSVIAETLKDNKPSQRVLEKVGMKRFKEVGDCFWYRIENK